MRRGFAGTLSLKSFHVTWTGLQDHLYLKHDINANFVSIVVDRDVFFKMTGL